MAEEESVNSVSVIWKSQSQHSRPPDLRLLHFNDVYHIEYDLDNQNVAIPCNHD